MWFACVAAWQVQSHEVVRLRRLREDEVNRVEREKMEKLSASFPRHHELIAFSTQLRAPPVAYGGLTPLPSWPAYYTAPLAPVAQQVEVFEPSSTAQPSASVTDDELVRETVRCGLFLRTVFGLTQSALLKGRSYEETRDAIVVGGARMAAFERRGQWNKREALRRTVEVLTVNTLADMQHRVAALSVSIQTECLAVPEIAKMARLKWLFSKHGFDALPEASRAGDTTQAAHGVSASRLLIVILVALIAISLGVGLSTPLHVQPTPLQVGYAALTLSGLNISAFDTGRVTTAVASALQVPSSRLSVLSESASVWAPLVVVGRVSLFTASDINALSLPLASALGVKTTSLSVGALGSRRRLLSLAYAPITIELPWSAPAVGRVITALQNASTATILRQQLGATSIRVPETAVSVTLSLGLAGKSDADFGDALKVISGANGTLLSALVAMGIQCSLGANSPSYVAALVADDVSAAISALDTSLQAQPCGIGTQCPPGVALTSVTCAGNGAYGLMHNSTTGRWWCKCAPGWSGNACNVHATDSGAICTWGGP